MSSIDCIAFRLHKTEDAVGVLRSRLAGLFVKITDWIDDRAFSLLGVGDDILDRPSTGIKKTGHFGLQRHGVLSVIRLCGMHAKGLGERQAVETGAAVLLGRHADKVAE